MDQIYDKFKRHKTEGEKKINNFLKEMPKKLQDNLLQQEKNIEIKHKSIEDQVKVGDRLQKILRVDKKDLLMYKSQDFNRMKIEVKDLIGSFHS